MPRLRRHPAEIGQLLAVLDPLEAQGLALGLPRAAVLRLRLLAEELFINSVLHGCGRTAGGCVAWALKPGRTTLGLRYLDNGPPWPPPAQPGDTDPQRVGGQGLRLLEAMASRLTRRRLGGWNVVHLEILLRNGSCLPPAS